MTIPRLVAQRTPGAAGAPVILLCPSLGTTTRAWHAAAELLSADFEVFSWDLPGHGSSAPIREPLTIPDLAKGVLAIADEAGADRFLLAGVSLGGSVALQLAAERPDRVTGLAMLCSAAKIGEESTWRDRAQMVREQGTPALVEASARRWFAPGFIEREPELAGLMLHDLSDTDDESYARCCEALAEFDLRERLPEIAVPVLAVSGAEDEVVTTDTVREMSSLLPDGTAVEFDGVRHQAAAEAPDRVAARLRQFFLGNQEST